MKRKNIGDYKGGEFACKVCLPLTPSMRGTNSYIQVIRWKDGELSIVQGNGDEFVVLNEREFFNGIRKLPKN